MIPILYESTETQFNTNGIGRLADAITCYAAEARNGEYYLDMTYPISGKHYKDIQNGRLILARPEPGKEPQPFEIKHISRPMNGIISIEAVHISYRLSNIPVMPFTARSASEALDGLVKNSAEPNPFTVWTDKTVSADYTLDKPQSFRACLGGTEGSLLDTYGTAEYEFDRFRVLMHLHRGTDRGVVIRYGKNLTDIKQEESIENTVTGICPYWTGNVNDQSVTVTLPEKVIQSDAAGKYAYHRTVTVDLSQEIKLPEGTDQPTVDMLRAAAKQYVAEHDFGVPEVNLTVSYVDLADTVEYRDKQTEQVNLCDTVTVVFDRLGVNATAKVISVEYDVLLDRYNKIELGSYKNRLSDTILKNSTQTADLDKRMTAAVNDALKKIKENQDTFTKALQDEMERADKNTDEMIKSLKNLTGHAFIHYTEDGQPFEFIVSDNTDLSKAVKVWRWNENGLAYSSTGYNGTYAGAAITADGAINANSITTGKITAVDIEGVNIIGAHITATYKYTVKASDYDDSSLDEIDYIISGRADVTPERLRKYDLNKDGKIDDTDRTTVENMVSTKTDYTVEEKIDMDPSTGKLDVGGTTIQNGFVDTYSVNSEIISTGSVTSSEYMYLNEEGYSNQGLNGAASFIDFMTQNEYMIYFNGGLMTNLEKLPVDVKNFVPLITEVNGGSRHDIRIGWSGSRLVFYVDNQNVCSLPNGYRP